MTKIDEAMVERAVREWRRQFCEAPPDPPAASSIRAILEAALSPEPEIPVSEGMIEAGRPHIIAGWEERPQYYCIDLAAIYRAMESTRRKEAGEGVERWLHIGPSMMGRRIHRRSTDAQGPGAFSYEHRRKDDK